MDMNEAFKGIKVADFSWSGVGPMASRVLAEHGATVIRVESHKRPDSLRLLGPFLDGISGLDRSQFGVCFHTNKYDITLDMNRPKGTEAAKRLIMWADVVAESFSPGVMKKWGFDYERVVEFKPDIIYYSTTQQGQYGPQARFSGYGVHAASMAGFYEVTGWPDQGPSLIHGAYTDYISPWYLAVALIGALDRRRKSGKGMYLEQSQLEAGISFLGPVLLDYRVNGRIAGRMGNRDPFMAPHGAFRCMGTDRWVALAACNDKEWQAFCKVIDHQEWVGDPRFTTFKARKENEDELERLIEEWTVNYLPEEVMFQMQAAGVPAGVVQDPQDLFEDPQVKHRQAYTFLNHSVMGFRAYDTPAFRLSKCPWQPKKAPGAMGEDNEWVFKDILGYTAEEIAEMRSEDVITTEVIK